MKKKTSKRKKSITSEKIKVLNPTVESSADTQIQLTKLSIETTIYNLGEVFDGIGTAIIIYQKRLETLANDAQDTLDRLKSINKELSQK